MAPTPNSMVIQTMAPSINAVRTTLPQKTPSFFEAAITDSGRARFKRPAAAVGQVTVRLIVFADHMPGLLPCNTRSFIRTG